jgi:hypothetical protein
MKTMVRGTRPVAVAVLVPALLAAWLGLGSVAGAADEVTIEVVHVDLAGGTITITGAGFDNPQDTQVSLGGVALTITSETATSIVAALPAGTSPGSYLLDVIVTGGTSRSDEFDVTISNEPELEARIAALEALLAGVTRGTDGGTGVDTIRLTGANLQLVNGTGHTDFTANGAGNLILGYNTHNPLTEKTGSHVLVIGDLHSYTGSSGVVAGYSHILEGMRSSIVGGSYSTIDGADAFVGGGTNHSISGDRGFIGGGEANDVSAVNSIVAGGVDNEVTAVSSAILGGVFNVVSGAGSVVGGGYYHVAHGSESFIGGGFENTAPSTCSWIANVNINC